MDIRGAAPGGVAPSLSARDRDNCRFLLLGLAPDAPFEEPAGAPPFPDVTSFVVDICDAAYFREAVLSPLLLGEPLPHQSVAPAPPFKLIDWAQSHLPLSASARRAAGAARSWQELLELVLSDPVVTDLLPAFREAEIDVCLRERVERGPLARAERSVVGALDAVSAFEIRGWALDLCDKSVPVTLEFYADNALIGSVVCSEPRPDVQEAMGGDGTSGFHFRLATAHRASVAAGRTVTAIDARSRQPIGTPTVVHADPAAGWDVLQSAREELRAMRRAIERLEQRLPDLSRIASLPLDAYEDYWQRFYRPVPDVLRDQRSAAGRFAYRPLVSIVLPTWNSDPRLLDLAIDSVRRQSYPEWELLITDDASSAAGALDRARQRHGQDTRIRWLASERRGGIAANTNRGIAQASGDYVAFLDHDDELAPDALFHMVGELQTDRPGLLYSDEDRIEEDALGVCRHHTPFFKPAFDPDLLLSFNYICHLVVVRRALLAQVEGLRGGFEGAQDHDLLLRCVARLAPGEVRHVARILYHWRVTDGSVSRDPARRGSIEASIVDAVNSHLSAVGLDGLAEAHRDEFGESRAFATRVRWRLPAAAPALAVIIPTRDRLELLEPCVTGVLRSAADYPGTVSLLIVDNDSTEPSTLAYFAALCADARVRVLRHGGAFNWSAINNAAARATTADVLIFLNNDTVVRSADWLTVLAAQAMRADVGAVGARLLYADGTLQHAGVVLGVDGAAGHDCVGEAPQTGGYFGRTHVQRSTAAVTGACLATRRDLFEALGGFDEENLKVAFNDIDYCMKLRRAGRRIVYEPFAVLFHYESKSRGRELTQAQQQRHGGEAAAFRARWGDAVWEDPYFNPHFERFARPFERLRPPPEARVDCGDDMLMPPAPPLA